MKRAYLAAALLACAAACTTATNTNTPANTNAANTNAANSNTASGATWTNEDVIAGDRQAWELIRAKNHDGFAALLADDFVDVTPGKIRTKAETVAFVKTFDLTEASLSDFRVIRIDDDAAIITYTVKDKGTMAGKPIPADSKGMRHSTAKVLRGGKWLAVFHQVTPIMEMPPAPPKVVATNTNAANTNAANANAANSNSAAPAASPAATTADVEANERAVWAAIKAKNYDAFAGYLAEDMLEVEPDQVYTKAEAVAGIRQFDASKHELSDLRTVNLDADAKLVTYTVKGPGPGGKIETMYNSSIWALRGGKWVAVFHQGTPAMPGGM